MRHLKSVILACSILSACGGGGQTTSSLQTPGSGSQALSSADITNSNLAVSSGPKVAMNDVLGSAQMSAQNINVPTRAKAMATAGGTNTASSELFWYNPINGDTVAWGMNGATQATNTELLRAPGWQITHVADLNGDGQPDLVWQNYSTGQTVVWLMSGNTVLQSQLLLTAPGWRVIKTGDFNGDGKADLLWYNAQTDRLSHRR